MIEALPSLGWSSDRGLPEGWKMRRFVKEKNNKQFYCITFIIEKSCEIFYGKIQALRYMYERYLPLPFETFHNFVIFCNRARSLRMRYPRNSATSSLRIRYWQK